MPQTLPSFQGLTEISGYQDPLGGPPPKCICTRGFKECSSARDVHNHDDRNRDSMFSYALLQRNAQCVRLSPPTELAVRVAAEGFPTRSSPPEQPRRGFFVKTIFDDDSLRARRVMEIRYPTANKAAKISESPLSYT